MLGNGKQRKKPIKRRIKGKQNNRMIEERKNVKFEVGKEKDAIN